MDAVESKVDQFISENMGQLTEAIIACQLDAQPDIEERYDERMKKEHRKDVIYNLEYLAASVRMRSELLFKSYSQWLRVLLWNRLEIPKKDMHVYFSCFKQTINQLAEGEIGELILRYIKVGEEQFDNDSVDLPTFIADDAPLAVLATQYLNSLLEGNRNTASSLILKAVEDGVSIRDLYLSVFEPAQYEIGRLWQINKINVAQEHYCTAASQLIMSQLYPYIFKTEKKGFNLVATCVEGELHEIGIRMVADLFEIDGWNTFYLGSNTPTASIIQTLIDRNAHILAISATMTTHLPAVESLIQAVKNNPDTENVIILVGGRPFAIDPDLHGKIGADGYATNAADAVEVGNRLVSV